MRRIILVTALLCSAILGYSGAYGETLDTLKQDSGTNLSMMNLTFTVSPTFGSAQTVKFTAPTSKWMLKGVRIMATDGWHAKSNATLEPLPFAIEIRDADLRLLYHYADTQLPYFSANSEVRMASVEVPDIPIKGDFFVCFYGYRNLGLATELQNATGNSYLFDKLAGRLYSYELPLFNNQTLPVNFLIRALGK